MKANENKAEKVFRYIKIEVLQKWGRSKLLILGINFIGLF